MPDSAAALSPENSEPRVRGVLFGSFVTWLRGAYGEEHFAKFVARLPPEDRPIVQGSILPVQVFSFAPFMRAIDTAEAMAVERGESLALFRRRVVSESGGGIVRTFYKLLLLLASPTSLVKQLPMFYERALLGGRCEVLRNERGHAAVRYSGPALMERYMRDSRAPIVSFLLEQNGAKKVACRFENELSDGVSYRFDLVVDYE